MTLLEAATDYAARGWAIFPCEPCGKRPLTNHGCRDATTNETTIRQWWARWPDANIGLACGKASGISVVDVDFDEEKGIDGYESLKAFAALPDTVRQSTPRGGMHFLFKTGDNPPRNKNSFRPGIDIRADGYYIILAPSIHPNGLPYEWVQERGPDAPMHEGFPADMRPKARPPWARSQPAPQPKPKPAVANDIIERASRYLQEVPPAIQGSAGHDALLWAARCMVVGFELPRETALDLLWNEYNPRCVPPWEPKERRDFDRKIDEALKTPGKNPPGWLLDEYNLQRGNDDAATREKADALAEALMANHRKKNVNPEPESGADEPATNEENPAGEPAAASGRALSEISVADLAILQKAVGKEMNRRNGNNHKPYAIGELRRPQPGDPSELLEDRFLCRGGGMLLVGPSGIGKSSLVVQSLLCWSVGKPALGIRPARPLKTLLIQAENDAGDLAEMRDGVISAMRQEDMFEDMFTEDDARQATSSLQVLSINDTAGDPVADLLLHHGEGFDLVCLDPLFSFCGCDVMSARDVSHFLRETINPVLTELNCGIIMVHHSNKPLRGSEKNTWAAGDFAYLGAGSAELTNWPRAVVALRSIGHETVYELRAAKRGRRLGWLDDEDRPFTHKLVGHSEHGICWREISPEEAIQFQSNKDNIVSAPAISEILETAIDIYRDQSCWKKTELKERIACVTGKSFAWVDRNVWPKLREQEDYHDQRVQLGKRRVELVGQQYAVEEEAAKLKSKLGIKDS